MLLAALPFALAEEPPARPEPRLRIGVAAGLQAQLGATGEGVGALRIAYGPIAIEPAFGYTASEGIIDYPDDESLIGATYDYAYTNTRVGALLRARIARAAGVDLGVLAGGSHTWAESSMTWETPTGIDDETTAHADLERAESTSLDLGFGATVPLHPRVSLGADVFNSTVVLVSGENEERTDADSYTSTYEYTTVQLRPCARLLVVVWL